MAFKAVFEILVHLETFKNIDLACQGLYKLRTTVFNAPEGSVTYATPISNLIANSHR
jgi:hypothetical protein